MPPNNFLGPKSNKTSVAINRFDKFDYMDIQVIGL